MMISEISNVETPTFRRILLSGVLVEMAGSVTISRTC